MELESENSKLLEMLGKKKMQSPSNASLDQFGEIMLKSNSTKYTRNYTTHNDRDTTEDNDENVNFVFGVVMLQKTDSSILHLKVKNLKLKKKNDNSIDFRLLKEKNAKTPNKIAPSAHENIISLSLSNK